MLVLCHKIEGIEADKHVCFSHIRWCVGWKLYHKNNGGCGEYMNLYYVFKI